MEGEFIWKKKEAKEACETQEMSAMLSGEEKWM